MLGGPVEKFLIARHNLSPSEDPALTVGVPHENGDTRINYQRVRWPKRSRSLALISDLSLGPFLAMSLMSLQLWTLAGMGGSILLLLVAQVVVITLFVIFVVFRIMGRDYDAAVMSAGYVGLGLGATPTAIANMTAVTADRRVLRRHLERSDHSVSCGSDVALSRRTKVP